MKKIRFERINYGQEYKKLYKFIESPGFDYVMKNVKDYSKMESNVLILIYYPKYEEIKCEYPIVLCPSFTSSQKSEDNNDNNDAENEENYLVS